MVVLVARLVTRAIVISLGSALFHLHLIVPIEFAVNSMVIGIRRQARVNAVCVAGAGLDTAIYCDIVNRFYTPGNVRSSNQWPPVGLAAVSPLPPDAPMVKTPVARTMVSSRERWLG